MPSTLRIRSTDRDDPDPDAIDEAARLLRSGGLVAFATETVYGLGAVATDPVAVARIFAAKGRPPANPLIVHADALDMARACVAEWPDSAATLADRFWPGPLTLVLPRSSIIPDLVTAGLDTVGVRIPAPLVARRLIERVGRPIAAPSANRSNGLSPTTARHVLDDLGDRVDLILDSGPTTVGLESTVIDLNARPPRLLRPGPITIADLERALGGRMIEPAVHAPGGRPASPGQMATHYAPRTRAVRTDDPGALAKIAWPDRTAFLVIGEYDRSERSAAARSLELRTPESAARDLYAALHDLDALGLDLIVIITPPDRPEWQAIRDRIARATENLTTENTEGTEKIK